MKHQSSGNFHLSKWFLDFVGENGEAMIFYSAKLTWHGFSASYTSWLHVDNTLGVLQKSRFRKVRIPQIKDKFIVWSDAEFGVSGTWEPMTKMIQTRLVDTDEGFLEWYCLQPSSKVHLRINDRILNGSGYAEQLILTIPPWRIPMDELRWGHFDLDQINIVWIEIREKVNRQWLWLNGDKMGNGIIEDDHISIPERDLTLYLDCGVVLESEKKIFSVVQKLMRYIPGFKKVMPINFLMADEVKWLSNGQLQTPGKTLHNGMAIHERVNFKSFNP